LKHFFENHRGSGAARFFYKPSRRGSFFSNVVVRQRQLFSRDGHLAFV
jgi:hypothetical protein